MPPANPAALSPDEMARDLLSGELAPRDYAQRVVPAPLQSMRITRAEAALDSLLATSATLAACASAIAALMLVISDVPRHLLLVLLVPSLAGLSLLQIIRRLVYRRMWGRVQNRDIDHEYRRLFHDAYVQRAVSAIEALPTNEAPDPSFVQSLVQDLQRALHHVGAPNPQVCILRREGSRDVVSYYAGPAEPTISHGAVLYDFASTASRRVVYAVSCSMGLEGQQHRLVVVATATHLDPMNEKLVRDTAALLTAACTHTTCSDLISA